MKISNSLHCLILSLPLLWLSACSTYPHRPTAEQLHGERGALKPSGDYIVQAGDTLFGISWRYGLDINELARWNRIADKDRILAGQRLRLTPPSGVTPAKVIAPTVTSAGLPGWTWPTRGDVVQQYSANEPGRQGIRLRGQRGQAIHAAAAGEVAYTGTGLSGFGRMVIIRHPNRVLSAYGYLDSVNVSEGQKLSRGQQIGTMGIGSQNMPTLHFETRKQGKAVNPYGYIGTTPRY